MQKFIRIMAVVAVVLMGVSLLLLLVTVPMQPVLARWLRYPEDILGILPRFPLIPVLFCLLRLGCAALLLIFCGNKKGGIWLEVIAFACMAVILPALNHAATSVYSLSLSQMGAVYTAVNSLTSNVAFYCMIPAGLGQSIAYATCGMSIAFKKMSKRTEKSLLP